MSLLSTLESIDAPELSLRRVHAGDLPALLAVNGDPEVTRFLPYRPWRDLDDATAWLARMQALHDGGSGAQLVLQRRADAALLGTLLLFRLDADHGRVEIGYVLGRAHWGGGWMRRALLATCAHAFGTLGLRRIEAEVQPANTRSAGLLRRVGFTHEGTARRRWVGSDGVPYDTLLFGLLADDPVTAV